MSRDPYCLCPSCLGTQIKDEECHMTKYNCNCDASAGAPDHARTCPQHRDFGKISGRDIVDAYESRGTSTVPPAPGRTRHPLVNIAEWRKGCSCAPSSHPVRCEECTEGLIRAVENWFVQHRSAYPFDVPALLSDLDGLTRKYDLPELRFSAAKLIRTFEADLYAAQDQVAGLQDLMGTGEHQRKVQLLADRKNRVYLAGPMTGIEDYNFPAFNALADQLRAEGWHVENPADHGHVEGAGWADYLRYDIGCLASCEAIMLLPGWSKSKGATLEVHIAQQIGVTLMYVEGAEVAQPLVSREAELHAALVKAQKVIDMLFPGVSKIFGVDFQELNESLAAVSQALKAGKLKCSCCGLTDVSLELSCHNSDCQGYAEQVTVYEGWK